MIFNFFKICFYVLIVENFSGLTFGVKLGDTCLSNQECDTEFSRCHQESGICSCLPYYARANNTCLQSSLLGFECIVNEQCSLKVANSECFNNVCQCQSKFWQYRRHTCLPPAKLGEVCYSDAHCALSDGKNKCQFTIPGVLGFCVCDSASQADCALRGQNFTVPDPNPNNTMFKYPFGKPDPKKKVPYPKRPVQTVERNTTGSSATTTVKPLQSRPSPSQPSSNKIWRPSVLKTNTTNAIKATDAPAANDVASKFPVFSIPTPSPIKFYMKSPIKDSTANRSQTPPADGPQTPVKVQMVKKPVSGSTDAILRKGDPKRRVSLGFPCVSDAQCMRNDENSRCVRGVCDCQPNNKTTTSDSQCSAKSRGCLQNTFQCRSSGKCISWFFVCDGRTGDCGEGDNSDEECSANPQCPSTSFACRSGGNGLKSLCVSRSARCDGVKNCPLGDDEEGCNVVGHKGCPAYTFQCGDGKCLPEYELCNAVVTCADKSDELEGLCSSGTIVTVANSNGTTVARPSHQHHRRSPHQNNYRHSLHQQQLQPPLTRVRGAYRHSLAECPFRCRNGRCRSTAVLCSGRDGCGDGSDESGCSVCKCPAVS